MSEQLGKPLGDIAETAMSAEKQSSGCAGGIVPRVSIGLPVYNGETFLEQALDSLLSQTYQDFELIISDNASTDHTERICRTYAARDHRIRYYRNNKNCGASYNFNRVVELARGEYFKWAAHDDLHSPEFLQECVSAMDRDPGIILCYSWTKIVDGEGRPIRNLRSPIGLLGSPLPYERFRGAARQDRYCCYEVFGLLHTAVLRQTRLLEPYGGSDLMLLADLALLGRFHEVPAYLFFNREHPERHSRAYARHRMHLWFDPTQEGKIPLIHWRWLWEYSRSVGRSSLSRSERLRCYAALFPWVTQYLKEFAVDLRVAGMLLLRRFFPRTGELVSRMVHGGPRTALGTTNAPNRKLS